MRFLFHVGWRYLLSRKRHALLSLFAAISILGVAVGTMALTVAISAISGFQEAFREKILGNNAPLILFSHQGSIQESEDVATKVRSNPDVSGVSPFLYSESLIQGPTERTAGVIIYGIDPKEVKSVTSLGNDLVMGNLDDLNGTESGLPGIILGESLAIDDLYVAVGDAVDIISPQGELTPFGFGPKVRRYEVVALFKSGMSEFDKKSVYTHLQQAQSFFERPKEVDGYQISVHDMDKAFDVRASLEKEVGNAYYIRHWLELNGALFEAFRMEKTVFFIVLAMIVLVASFNIIGTLTLIVFTKRKEIAILKAMGATSKKVAGIFMVCGGSIGLFGVVLGLTLGALVCVGLKEYFVFPLNAQVYQVSQLPIRMEPLEFLVIGAAGLVISLLATVYPAVTAGRMPPSEGFRNE